MPARRPGGKAASRKARQRYVPRTPKPASTAPAPADADADAPADTPHEAIEAVAPTDTPTASVVTESAPASASVPRGRRPAPVGATSGGSGLSARDRADYHYVERDLRNIGILTLVMAAMLLGAWLLFNAVGLVG